MLSIGTCILVLLAKRVCSEGVGTEDLGAGDSEELRELRAKYAQLQARGELACIANLVSEFGLALANVCVASTGVAGQIGGGCGQIALASDQIVDGLDQGQDAFDEWARTNLGSFDEDVGRHGSISIETTFNL